MKKSLSQAIALATVLAAAATTTQAAVGTPAINGNGVGSALLFPLYTVDNNNSTLLSITNTTDEYKAVKVRFLEGMNSAEVLDFHLYLSPEDVWSGSIVATADGAKLVSNDTSCIVGMPNGFPKAGLEFRTTEINKDGDDKSLQTKDRTRVGHFEVIEMGVVNKDAIIAFSGATPVTAGAAIKHVAGKPGSCAAVTAAWNAGGRWHTAVNVQTPVSGILATPSGPNATTTSYNGSLAGTAYAGNIVSGADLDESVTVATGGLYGTAAIVNVKDSWAATYDATAMTGIYAAEAEHPYPGTIFPHLLSGIERKIGSYGFGITADDGTSTFADLSKIQNNVVTAALIKGTLNNDYYVDPALAAETDFVITFPTKRFHVNAKTAAGKPLLGATFPLVQLSPFSQAWDGSKDKGESCDNISVAYYDKEEARETVELEHISPLPDNKTSSALCHETNIFGLNDSNIFGGANVRNNFALADNFLEGWMGINLSHAANTYTVYVKQGDATNAFTEVAQGLPVVGFSAITTKNGVSKDGVVKNFGQSFSHKYN